ncbi:MAG TPA: thiamine phosphate synthase [Burkholderiales bacterium]|nr:thiamine phosphate synthase [Burkholderiales bacterium]
MSSSLSSPLPSDAPGAAGASARVRGLYAVTPDEPDTDLLTAKVERCIRGGVRLVQYRNKTAIAALRRRQIVSLLALCRRTRVPLIVNDDLELAFELDADGVHLGRDDADLVEARRRLAPGKLLGASCYDSLELARSAVAAGSDYVAFGAAFPTARKPAAPRASLGLYAQAKAALRVPIVAIGGITPVNAASLREAGADAVAVISSLFGAADIEARAREFCAIVT